MSALAAISLINGIIQLAPSLTSLFKGSEKNVAAAELAAKVARNVTGTLTNEDALTSLTQNPEQLIAYEREIREHQRELENLHVEDKKSARERDAEYIRSGARNYRADSLAVVCVLVIVLILAILVWVPQLDDFAKGTITTILGAFLLQLNNIYSFEFGTTRKSDESNKKLIDDYISIPPSYKKSGS